MTAAAILLIVLSSFTHAGWNLLGKNSRATPASFVMANMAGVVLLLPAVVIFFPLIRRMSGSVWGLLGVTGAFQALYYASLSSAYRRGDMSVAYPIARALPILFVTAMSFLLGRGKAISHLGLIGFAAVLLGALLLPMRSFRVGSLRIYRHANLLFALLAAAGTAGYSMVDSDALRLFRGALPALGSVADWEAPLVYSFFEAAASALWLTLGLSLSRRNRRWLREAVVPSALRSAIVMGAGIYLTYTLVLISMGFVANVSYVVAFRQLSIPIGVVLGIVLLKEPPHTPKLVATFVMVAGLFLTAVG